MGLNINYWRCKFSEYDEIWDGKEELRIYNCTHKKGCGTCELDNKWNGDEEYCDIAELE